MADACVQQINQNQSHVNQPTNKDSRSVYAVISCVAFAAIALIVAMVVCLHFEVVSPIVAYSLMGVGGAALLANFIAFVKICFCTPNPTDDNPAKKDPPETDPQPSGNNNKDKNKNKQPPDPIAHNSTTVQNQGAQNTQVKTPKNNAYSISAVSWNIGLNRDYSHMCYVREMEKKGVSAGQSLAKVFTTPFQMHYQLTMSDFAERRKYFEEAFTSFNHPDIVCLQECRDMSIKTLEELLPGYVCLSSENIKTGTNEHVIAWDASKFTLLNQTLADYSLTKSPSNPAFIVHLEDNATKKTVCVCSSHFPGYNLNWQNITDYSARVTELNNSELLPLYAKRELDSISQFDADLNLHMGDYNTFPEELPDLFKTFRSSGYATDLTDTSPTIYDANLRLANGTPTPIRIDHMHASAKENVTFSFKYQKLPGFKINQFTRRPSDHLPVAGVATLTGA